MKLLDNYRQLVKNVDDLCGRVEERFAEHLACRKGCDECCRHLSLFPVEAMALAEALQSLPEPQRQRIRRRAAEAAPEDACPLLDEGACLLYHARPIICRTHGLPILTPGGLIDFCPRNFRNLPSLPGDAVLDLERLNTALAGVNALFVARQSAGGTADNQERLTIAEALLLSGYAGEFQIGTATTEKKRFLTETG